MPLIHLGNAINRVLGVITAIEPPFWLGAEKLTRQEFVELHLHWPDGGPRLASPRDGAEQGAGGAEIVRMARRRFRVYDGGLTGSGEQK